MSGCVGLRRALVVLTVGALAACSSAGLESSAGFNPNNGSGDDGGASEDGGGPPGDGSMGDVGSGGGVTRVTFVQASPSLGNVRLCWSVNGANMSGDPPFPSEAPMPASNYPGIPQGGVAWVDAADADKLVAGSIALYALDADLLADTIPHSCADLLCPDPSVGPPCLKKNEGNWKVADVAVGLLESRAGNVVAIEGCLPSALDTNATAERCGAKWTAAGGNLHARVVTAGSGNAEPGALLVQAVQLSAAFDVLLGASGKAQVAFGAKGGGAAIGTFAREGELAPQAPTLVTLGSGLAGFGTLGFAIDVQGVAEAGTGAASWDSLAQSQSIVAPTQSPADYYGVRSVYFAALVGDPNDATGSAERALHFVVFPAQGQGGQAQ